jgi:molybdopterin/thiamine biosynthesis adenylyltransferase
VRIRVADGVLRAIAASIGARAPERGGALLGPPGRLLVTAFEPDPEPGASAAWSPSRALAARVRAREEGDGLEWKGLVHSHPAGVDRPSAQDAREAAAALAANPRLAALLVPIVTQGEPAAPAAHELALGGARISWFSAARDEPPAPVAVSVLPLLRDLERAARERGGGAPELLLASVGGVDHLAGRVSLAGVGDLLVIVPDAYPDLPPLLWEGGTQLEAPWRLSSPPEDRLAEALARASAAARPAPDVAGALLALGEGLLHPALRERTVLLAGLGSVGSYLGEQLVRSGVGGLALLDPERVEAANLSRAAYEAHDVGATKAEALARRLRAVNPAVRLALHACAVEAFSPAELDALVRGADLVVAATDDPAAQRALCRFAYARGKAALFPGLHAGARGGEVVISVPEQTACYLCATRARHGPGSTAPGAPARELDYGTGRLAAEPALAADVQHVASAALKLALALLVPPEAPLAAFARGPITAGTTFLTLSTVPDYWFYPALFAGVPGQGAYQAVWLTPDRAVDCPVCGAPEHRAEPLEVPLRGPGRDAFRGFLGRSP